MQNLLNFIGYNHASHRAGEKLNFHVVDETKTATIIANIPLLLSNPLIFSTKETEGLNPSGLGLTGF